MLKFFQSVLSAKRRRRSLIASAAIWLLRLIRDVEETELDRFSDELDKLDSNSESVPRHVYSVIEDEYTDCECALGYLESAIEDLEFAYCERF